MSHYLPSVPQVTKETVAVVLGAFLGIALIHLLPPKYQKYFILNPGTL